MVTQEVTPDLAKLFNVPPEKGALISDVAPGGPAAQAGLKKGDVIEELNDQPIAGPNELKLRVATLPPGSVAHLVINRHGQQQSVSVKLGELPEKGLAESAAEATEKSPLNGVQVDRLTPSIARELRLPAETQGVVVTDVDPGSAAADAGLRRGDVIEEINRQPVRSPADFQRALRSADNQTVILLVNRQGMSTYIALQPE